MVTRDWAEALRSFCVMVREFQVGKMTEFWRWQGGAGCTTV